MVFSRKSYLCSSSFKQKRARGFDQAAQLSECVAGVFGVSSDCLLERKINTDPQAQKDKTERRVGDWGKIFRACLPLECDKKIFVCDDVYTTGTTLSAAAQKLIDSGINEVWGFTLARG